MSQTKSRYQDQENKLQWLEQEIINAQCGVSKLPKYLDIDKEKKFIVIWKLFLWNKNVIQNYYNNAIEGTRTEQRDFDEKSETLNILEIHHEVQRKRKKETAKHSRKK